MPRKPQKILLGALLLIAIMPVGVHLAQVGTAKCHQQSLDIALLHAIPNHRFADIRELLRRGADPNCQQQPTSLEDRLYSISPSDWHHFYSGPQPLLMTPLGLAVLNCQQDTIQVLLDAGAKVDQKDSYGETALDIDANGQDKIYEMLKAAEEKQKKNHILKEMAIDHGR